MSRDSSLPLFVYGSLKEGGRHHDELDGAAGLGVCRTAARYRLVVLGGYPALCPGGDKAITGELYRVDERLLGRLDTFEGQAYVRQEIELCDGRLAQAYSMADGRFPAVPFPGESWPDG